VLFSDIRNFTGMSEELGPHPTVALLNEYFTIMVECIQRQGGMLDKFIGDAIMAVFGLPMAHEDDADRAVRAAISMITELRRWNVLRAAASKAPLDIGIGIHTDRVVSGNIGSPRRMDYTVIGDGVNLASRLEGLNKQYGTTIIVTQSIRSAVGDAFQFRLLDRVAVKGKMQPVEIYQLLGDRTEPNLRTAAIEIYESALRAHWQRDFNSAIGLLQQHPTDPPSQVLLERCRMLLDDPPAADWNGVFVAMMK
jgi:adenylate cyclase